MKTASTPFLLAVLGIVLCAGPRAMAQNVIPQQPGPYTEQPMPNPMPYDNGVAEPAYLQNGEIMDQGPAYPQAPEGVAPGDGFLMDNGLWDGAPAGPCCSNCGGGCCCPPDWYTEQGVRLLSRSRPRDVVIGNVFQGAFIPILTSRSAAPDVSAFYSMTIGHYFARDRKDRDHFIEFSYWGANQWKDKAERRGSGNLYSEFLVNGFELAGFDYADLHSVYYASFTNNFELNGRFTPRGRPDRMVLHPNGKWRRECQPGTYMSYLYGLRFFQENETFRFHGESTSGGTSYAGDYDIFSHNNLLGLQVGADMSFRQCKWQWGIRAKLGPYINFSDQQSSIEAGVVNAPAYSRRLSAAKHEASLIGETGFFTSYRFRPNLIGRASYDFMWVTGMALAPEQLQFTTNSVNQINTNGTILYQGVSLSMEWLW